MTNCRIGKIKFKDGPELSIIENDTPSHFVEQARRICASFDGNVQSHIMIAWDENGLYTIGYNLAECVITPTMAPAWLHDVMLRQVTENGTIEELDRVE